MATYYFTAVRLLRRNGQSASKKKSAAAIAQARRIGARRLLNAATHRSARTSSTPPASTHHQRAGPRNHALQIVGSKTNLVKPWLKAKARRWREWFIKSRWKRRGDAQSKLTRNFSCTEALVSARSASTAPLHQCRRRTRQGRQAVPQFALPHKKVVLAHIEKLAGEMGGD